MLAYWEEEIPVSIPRAEDPSTISCISWTGADTNDSLRETGWLVTGSSDGTVGITSTSTVPHGKTASKGSETGSYNLQQVHHNEITFVKFNKAMDFLASSDTCGIICVWTYAQKRWVFKYKLDAQGDVNSRVIDVIWCTQGLLLSIFHPVAIALFSIATLQATTYPLGFDIGHNKVHITISPCNGFLYVGTDQGDIRIIDLADSTTYHLRQIQSSIMQMCCSQDNTIAIGFSDGVVILMRNKDNERLVYKELDTAFKSYFLAWSESTDYLAILGTKRERTYLEVYGKDGELLVKLTVTEDIKPCAQKTLAMTWGHRDSRVFVSTGTDLRVARVVANNSTNLKEMSCIKVYTNGWKNAIMASPTLPSSIKLMLSHFMTSTIYDPISLNCTSMKDFNTYAVKTPGDCIYCTMKYNKLEHLFTLYMEHVGKLVPLLEARQIGRVRPKFLIYDRLSRDTKSQGEDTSETHILAQVHSNLWGTRFEILGTAQNKKYLAQVKYKLSLLHWQPRKMTLELTHSDKVGKSYTASDLLEEQKGNQSMHMDEDRIKLHNCSPQWNSEYNVFQLDCGGRITMESEKNFKFFFSGLQALQFGRVGKDSYTLDFSYPLSAIQAFGIALTSTTHRLK